MKPLRSLQIIAIIAILAAPCAFAQKKQKGDEQQPAPCPVAEVPAIRGFRLGMSLMDIKSALEDSSLFESKISARNNVGSRALRLEGSELKGDNAEGVDDVDLVFVDERLAYVKINFNSGVRFDSASDFFTRMSETLGLPRPSEEAGRGSNQRNQKYTVECRAFSVTLAYSFGVSPSVAITDTLAQKKVGDRRDKSDEGEVRTINITPQGRPPRTQPNPDPNPPGTSPKPRK